MAAAGKAIMLVTMIQMGICMGIGTVLTFLIYFGREWVISLFIKDAAVISLGAHLVTYQIVMGPFIGIYYLATNFLQVSGRWHFHSDYRKHGILLLSQNNSSVPEIIVTLKSPEN